MRLTSSGGCDSWREEGEATMVHDAPYRPLIRVPNRTVMLCNIYDEAEKEGPLQEGDAHRLRRDSVDQRLSVGSMDAESLVD
jgi:hypothetical protein